VALRYEAILIDADDTLFDFHRAESYALEQTLADHKLHIPVDSFIVKFRQINSAVWREYETGQATSQTIRTKRFVQLLQHLELDTNTAIDPQAVSDAYIIHLSDAAFLVDGAHGFLERLHGLVPIILLTNGLSSVQRPRLAAAGIERYFQGIVISEEVGVQKPDPEVFRIALEHAAGNDAAAGIKPAATGPVLPNRAIMIGDSLRSDIQGAMAFGLDACWFNIRGNQNDYGVEPTYTVTTLGEIPHILGLYSGQKKPGRAGEQTRPGTLERKLQEAITQISSISTVAIPVSPEISTTPDVSSRKIPVGAVTIPA
jgi:2-haloacid dehalogenase